MAKKERPLMFPREHGAYAELLFPVVTGAVASRGHPAALLLAAAFVVAFLAFEPVLILMGRRGTRQQRELATRAWRALVLRGVVACSLGFTGLVLAPWPARYGMALPVFFGVLFAVLSWRRLDHTLVGELAALGALTASAVPVAATGASLEVAALIWLGWAGGYGINSLAVHTLIALAKGTARDGARLVVPVLSAAVLAAGGVLLSFESPRWVLPAAVAPLAIASAIVVLLEIHPRRLPSVGWSLVVASFATFGVLIWASWA